jgi:hypothetical protein
MATTTTKRQRHVFPTHEVPHLWAHKTQNDARNPQGNLYFSGDTIYSYGSHFPIARHVMNGANDAAVLLTDQHYSVTTSQHVSAVRSSIPRSIPVFEVPNPTDNAWRNFLILKDAAKHAMGKVAVGKRKSQISIAWTTAKAADADAEKFARFFDYDYKSVLPDRDERDRLEAIHQEYENALTVRRANLNTKREARHAEARRLRALELPEKLEEWKSGAPVRLWGYDVPHLLRVKGDQIETTLGATVPVEHVKKVLPLVLQLIRAGRTYEKNGHSIHLGYYTLDKIDESGTVHVGCHRIEKAEVERIAEQLQ